MAANIMFFNRMLICKIYMKNHIIFLMPIYFSPRKLLFFFVYQIMAKCRVNSEIMNN